jgi:hypothetical protein
MRGRGYGGGRGRPGPGAGSRWLRDSARDQGVGIGSFGVCVCPKCGRSQTHTPGVPCLEERCPECGCALVREGSPHHMVIEGRRTESDEG